MFKMSYHKDRQLYCNLEEILLFWRTKKKWYEICLCVFLEFSYQQLKKNHLVELLYKNNQASHLQKKKKKKTWIFSQNNFFNFISYRRHSRFSHKGQALLPTFFSVGRLILRTLENATSQNNSNSELWEASHLQSCNEYFLFCQDVSFVSLGHKHLYLFCYHISEKFGTMKILVASSEPRIFHWWKILMKAALRKGPIKYLLPKMTLPKASWL